MLEITAACLQPGGLPFDHQFPSGCITVVLGANQAGKTNLCRLIAGLESDAVGRVCLDGNDISGHTPARRSVAMVYQAFVNYPNLTVAENIASPMVAARVPARHRNVRVAELARSLRLEPLLMRLPDELSAGQQQRLAIARALAKQAQVLLLDEPLVNLDFKLRETLELELRDLLLASNTTVVYTSSDPRDAFTLGDEVLLLHDAQKLQAGPPLAVYNTPNQVQVMHLLSDPGANVYQHSQQGNQQVCALRPEHLRTQAWPGETCERFAMRVTAVETSGDESFLHGRVAVGDQQRDWVARLPGMSHVRSGDDISLFARQADIQVFPVDRAAGEVAAHGAG